VGIDGLWGAHKSLVRPAGEGRRDAGEENGEGETPLHDAEDGRGGGDVQDLQFTLFPFIPINSDAWLSERAAHGVTVIAKSLVSASTPPEPQNCWL
jgi:hypothetical protein